MEHHTRTVGLDELVCFDLYAASRAVTAAYRPVLADLALTYPQYLVLVVLWERGACPIKELAAALRLDHATLTPLLRRVEAAGLLSRERDEGDARSVTVRLTPAGRHLQQHAPQVQCRIEEALGLSRDELTTLQRLLRSVTGSAVAAPGQDRDRDQDWD